jgi:hypothetical protein
MQEHGLPVVVESGELDPRFLESGTPPVVQLSTNDSISAVINFSRLPNARGGVSRTAADLIGLFGKASVEPKYVECS